MFQDRKITFYSPYADGLLSPVPIKKIVPEWFKKMPGTFNNSNKERTVKKCVPFLDTLTCGYAVLNPIDIFFKKAKDGSTIEWKINDSFPLDGKINIGIQTHANFQISKEMVREDEDPVPFKLLNPWMIKTQKNYSCLFTNPFNYTSDRRIRILDGIVDTDKYDMNINFPFFLKKLESEEEYILKKGEPIALIFPFLRDNWKMVIDKTLKNERDWYLMFMKKFSTIFDNYKNNFWSKKNYD